MLTIVCSGPARTRGALTQALVAFGAEILRAEDRNLGGLPDWPEDADAVAAAFLADGDEEAHAEWSRIAEERRDVDVDWIEAHIADELLDDITREIARWGWLMRMHASPQPAGPAQTLALDADEIVAAAERRVLDRLRERGVI